MTISRALLLWLAAATCACSQTIEVLMSPTPIAPIDGGPLLDPDGFARPDAGAAANSPCGPCGFERLCAVDRCVDARGITVIASSFSHTCSVQDGRLYCWGAGELGQLGTGAFEDRSTRTRVGTFNDWLRVSTGEHSTCAIRAPGTLYCFGDNASGELGTGDNEPHPEPTLVPTPLLREIACGGTGCCALSGAGELACWGDNLEGKAGQADPFGSQDATEPLAVERGSRFARVTVGQGHVCAIRESGALACWGRNSDGQIGLGPEPGQVREPTPVGVETDWQGISGSQHHTCGVRGDGSLWCWGRNEHFELNAPEPLTVYYEPRQVGSELDWEAVVVGWFHTCARKRAGQLWCWGRAIEGQLGVTSVEPIPDPTPVAAPNPVGLFTLGNFHTCAVDPAGALYCWGLNTDGQLGLGDVERRHEPVLVP